MRVVHLIFYYSRSGTKTSTCICTEQPIADDAINDLCIIIIMTIIENRSRNGQAEKQTMQHSKLGGN